MELGVAGVSCLVLVLGLLLAVHALEADHKCKFPPPCMWLDELQRKHKMPLNRDISFDEVQVYCRRGYSKLSLAGLLRVWHSADVTMTTDDPNDLLDLKFAVGNSTSSLLDNPSLPLLSAQHSLHLSLYHDSYLAVIHEGENTVSSLFYRLDVRECLRLRYPLILLGAVVLYLSAPYISRNTTAYYSTGVVLGVMAFTLILLYQFSKAVPKKSVMGLGVLMGGWTVFGSFCYWCWSNAMETAVLMWQYLLAYAVVTGLITFAALYLYGPPSPRALNLIQWGTQLVSVLLVLLSFRNFLELGGVFLACLLLRNCVSAQLVTSWCPCLGPVVTVCQCLWRCVNPFNWFRRWPTRRLLTMEEYEEQGRVETAKELGKLRQFCKEDKEIWSTVAELNDSKRFVKFLSGESHVSSVEQTDHDFQSFVIDSSVDGEWEGEREEEGGRGRGEEGYPRQRRLMEETPPSPFSPSLSLSSSPSPSPLGRRHDRHYYHPHSTPSTSSTRRRGHALV